MTKRRDKKSKFSIKLIFNPDLPLDCELIRVLKDQPNMTAYIKFALYQYINAGEKDRALNEHGETARKQPPLQKERAVSPGKEKPVYQWDKDAAFADAFEPLK